MANGYDIYPDATVVTMRKNLERYIQDHPSIVDVLTPQTIAKIVAGEATTASVPLGPAEWTGLSHEEQHRLRSRLEDALLLGIPTEELNEGRQREATALRVRLGQL